VEAAPQVQDNAGADFRREEAAGTVEQDAHG
jgi:hypothetical protein